MLYRNRRPGWGGFLPQVLSLEGLRQANITTFRLLCDEKGVGLVAGFLEIGTNI